jgi:hypothetical protein
VERKPVEEISLRIQSELKLNQAQRTISGGKYNLFSSSSDFSLMQAWTIPQEA